MPRIAALLLDLLGHPQNINVFAFPIHNEGR
jgi:hypothetical protein